MKSKIVIAKNVMAQGIKEQTKSTRLALFELLAKLNKQREEARIQHHDGNSDSVYYEAGAQLKLLSEVIADLMPIAENTKE